MAAPRGSSQGSDSDSSGSEDRERLREATWEPPGIVRSQQVPVAPVVPSLRVRPDSHEHDGNELQTTPEFRTHVAKKLTAILDSCIKEIPGSSSLKQESKIASNTDDEGFRLFWTSVPGDSGTVISPSICKRRVASSTSEDSEEEKQQRCREAAVSGLDILKHSALQSNPVETSDKVCHNQIKKKCKKKKKKHRELVDEIESDDQNIKPETEKNGIKKKKKEGGFAK